jgi:hypothetical protein
MNKKNTKNTKKRARIADMEFSQPREFVAATGYGNTRFHLDSKGVSLHVSSEANRNLQIGKTQ